MIDLIEIKCAAVFINHEIDAGYSVAAESLKCLNGELSDFLASFIGNIRRYLAERLAMPDPADPLLPRTGRASACADI